MYAAAKGVVTWTDEGKEHPEMGIFVMLSHGTGLTTGYLHFSKRLVEEDATVDVGDAIGLVGATGNANGSHLHWEVRYGSTSVDPKSLVELLSDTLVGPETSDT